MGDDRREFLDLYVIGSRKYMWPSEDICPRSETFLWGHLQICSSCTEGQLGLFDAVLLRFPVISRFMNSNCIVPARTRGQFDLPVRPSQPSCEAKSTFFWGQVDLPVRTALTGDGSTVARSPWNQTGLVEARESLGRPSAQGDIRDRPVFPQNRAQSVQEQTEEFHQEEKPWKPRGGRRIRGNFKDYQETAMDRSFWRNGSSKETVHFCKIQSSSDLHLFSRMERATLPTLRWSSSRPESISTR